MNYFFQCMNTDCLIDGGCPFIFEAATPICPKCEQGPPFTGTVVIMHYAYYDKGGKMKGYMGRKISIACLPGVPLGITPYCCSTGYLPLVNCPACKRSDIYKAMWKPIPEDINSYFENPNISPEEREKNLYKNLIQRHK